MLICLENILFNHRRSDCNHRQKRTALRNNVKVKIVNIK